jgi:hypothetical protein
MVAIMKLLYGILLVSVIFVGPVAAQSTANRLSAAARLEMDEKLKRLTAQVEDLQALNGNLARDLKIVSDQVRRQNDAMKDFAKSWDAAFSDYVRKKELLDLRKMVEEIEKRRVQDTKLTKDTFTQLRKQIEKILDTPPTVIQVQPSKQNDARGTSGGPSGKWYTMERGQTVSAVIEAFNSELKSMGRRARISLSQVKAANPTINLDRIRIGEKLFIPIID